MPTGILQEAIIVTLIMLIHQHSLRSVRVTVSCIKASCVVGAASGYNGGPGSVGGTAYGVQGYDPYGHTQHAYGSSAMQPQAPSSPYGRSAAGAYGGAGGFASAMGAPPNPYATAAAPAPTRSPVRVYQTPFRVCFDSICASIEPLGRSNIDILYQSEELSRTGW